MSDMLFTYPTPEQPAKNPEPSLASKPYVHPVVDSKKTPLESLTPYIGGSNFLNVYYSQQLTDKEELKAFDPQQLNVYQTYHKINNFIIKLQGALSPSDESSATGRFNLTGTAIVPPIHSLIPNVGDALIADIGEGRAGQFTVTSVRKMTINFASAWSIDFKLERIADSHIVKLLDSKVTKELFYNKDFAITGQNPLLTLEDSVAEVTLNDHFLDIVGQFFRANYSHEVTTMTVPLQASITYDHYVTKAMMRMITSKEYPNYQKIIAYNCDDYRINAYPDIYTAVINKDKSMLLSAFSEFRAVEAIKLLTSGYQNPVRYSGVKRVLVPYVTALDNDGFTRLTTFISSNEDLRSPSLSTASSGASAGSRDACGCSGEYNPNLIAADKEAALNKPTDIGMQIPKISNDSYVLSKAFFNRDFINCTAFELDIWKVVTNKPVDRKNVYAYCESFGQWGRLEQFFLTPLLLALIRHAINEI